MRIPASTASKKRPRLIAVDLDGTLLDWHGVPHERDVRALRAAMDEGIYVSIITGRLYSGTRPTAAAVGVSGPVGCADGSHLVNATDHLTLLHHGIRGQHALDLRDSLARHGVATFLFAEDMIVHDGMGDDFLGYVRTWSNHVERADRIHEHALWEAKGGLTAVVAVGTEHQIAKSHDEIRNGLAGAAQLAIFPVRRLPGIWGLVARAAGGTKGSALRWIAEHHGLSVEETVCVGDWMNDVPMMMVAGRAFAMGQAPEDVKAVATDVLEQTSERGGGVAAAVERAFGLLL
jgi:hydroxymethylpyrimidine pyrophosphatase-like HAD family hydrolase